jgi:hypothetical protein
VEPPESFRFDSIKNPLKALCFPSSLHLHLVTAAAIQSIDPSVLMANFNEWIALVEQCIQLNGDYFK